MTLELPWRNVRIGSISSAARGATTLRPRIFRSSSYATSRRVRDHASLGELGVRSGTRGFEPVFGKRETKQLRPFLVSNEDHLFRT
ncbi:MAG: hypothetical protein ACI835_000805 [Planctomycetota bacterium]|jgi:hypothetical protein